MKIIQNISYSDEFSTSIDHSTNLSKTSKSPIILRPISYVIKENLDNLFELKDQIDTQIENDLKLFDEGLDADLPI